MKPIHTIGRILPSPKDSLTLEEKSCLVYQVPCFDCDFVYIGQTKRDLKSRLASDGFYTERGERSLQAPPPKAAPPKQWREASTTVVLKQ